MARGRPTTNSELCGAGGVSGPAEVCPEGRQTEGGQWQGEGQPFILNYVLQVVCLDLRKFALRADKQKEASGKGNANQTLEKASEGIMACFRYQKNCKKTTLLWVVSWIRFDFNAYPDPAFFLNADPDPGSKTNADPAPYRGQTLKSQKLNFLHKNIL